MALELVKQEGKEMELSIELVLSAFESSLGNRQALYLSCPITTGKRALQFWAKYPEQATIEPVFSQEFFQEVAKPNREAAFAASERLEKLQNRPVINPAKLKVIPGWKRDHYHQMWKYIIQKHTSELAFVD